jgi:hypothetical protein
MRKMHALWNLVALVTGGLRTHLEYCTGHCFDLSPSTQHGHQACQADQACHHHTTAGDNSMWRADGPQMPTSASGAAAIL